MARIACAGALLWAAMATAAAAQAAPGWTVSCGEGGACVSHYAAPGLQILIGRGAQQPDRLYAEIRILPGSGTGSPVSIQVEDGWTGAMEVRDCNESYCSLALDLETNHELLAQFRAHRHARIAYLVDGAIVMVPFDLDGFSSALDRALAG